jgi:hypothetical protein
MLPQTGFLFLPGFSIQIDRRGRSTDLIPLPRGMAAQAAEVVLRRTSPPNPAPAALATSGKGFKFLIAFVDGRTCANEHTCGLHPRGSRS